MRRERAKRGEMLIETIVAFAVLMVLLTMVTTVVRGAIALNNRAAERLNALALDCANVESANYSAGSDVGRPTLTLTLDINKSSYVGLTPITEELKILKGGELRVFRLKADDGTNTGGGGNQGN